MRFLMLFAVAVILAAFVAPQPMSAESMNTISGACKCNGPQWPGCPYYGDDPRDCPGFYGLCPADPSGANTCQGYAIGCKASLNVGGDPRCARADTQPCL